MSDQRPNLDETYLQMAELWGSHRSYATRAKVGALLVKGGILSDGYNGMPSGFPNDEIEFKNPDGTISTNKLALHAESNAILKCGPEDRNGATLYCTYSPCVECSKLIIQSKIKRVVFRQFYRDTSALADLERAKIEIIHLPGNTPEVINQKINALQYDFFTQAYCLALFAFGFVNMWADKTTSILMLSVLVVSGIILIFNYLSKYHFNRRRDASATCKCGGSSSQG